MAVFEKGDLAIDLGTATTRVAGARSGISLRPSISRNIRALDRGVIVSIRAAAELLRPMIKSRRRAGLGRLRVLACAPTDVSALERSMVRSCVLEAGATSVIVVPEPLAAAVGSGIDISSPYAKFLIDFGDGVTDCAVIRDGKIIHSLAERVGCSDLRRSLQRFVVNHTGISIAEAEADRLLRTIGLTSTGEAACHGVRAGQPARARLMLTTLQAALRPVVDRMLAPMKSLLLEMPDPTGAEVIEDGIFLTGGGALLPGLREAVAAESAIDTRVVADPIGAVICGARRMLPLAATVDLWKSWGGYQRTLSRTTPLVCG